MLEAVQLPARVPALHPGLTDVNRNHFPHVETSFNFPPLVVFGVGERVEVAAASSKV